MFMRQMINNQKGVTYTEIIIYIGIVALVSSGIIALIAQLVTLKTNADSYSMITKEVSNVFEKVLYEVRNCDTFSVAEEGELTITCSGEDHVYALEDGKVTITIDGISSQLTSNLVEVISLEFVDWTSVNSADILHIEMDVSRGAIQESFQTSTNNR